MKLFAFGMISLLLVMVSCGESPSVKTKEAKEEKQPDQEIVRDLVAEYKILVSKLDATKVETISEAITEYQKLFNESSKQTCDTAFLIFHEYYEKMLGTLNKSVYSDKVLQNTEYVGYDENGKELPLPKPFKKLEDKVSKYGYRLEFPEGMISIDYDRSIIANNFYSFVSPEMKSFLEQLNHDDFETFGEDGGIIISEKAFVERLVWWENFNKSNPKFILHERATAIHQQLYTYFLLGMNNTPVYFDPEVETEGFIIEPYFVTAYELLEKKYPQSDAWKRTKPYKKMLLANDQSGIKKMIESYIKKGWIVDFNKEQEWYL